MTIVLMKFSLGNFINVYYALKSQNSTILGLHFNDKSLVMRQEPLPLYINKKSSR